MEFVKLLPAPGIIKETTRYASSSQWEDSDKIRFRAGLPEKIGGWQKLTGTAFVGKCRALHRWRTLDGTIYTGIGTHTRWYIEDGGTLAELTPWTIEDTGLATPFTTNSAVDPTDVKVTKTTHGRSVGDRIEIANADAVGGITAAQLNGTGTIAPTSDVNTYKFTSGGTATSSTTGGGASVTIRYILQDGVDQQITGTGWGSDGWNEGNWDEPGTAFTSTTGNIRTWSMDNFGEDMLSVIFDGEIFYWDATNGTSTRAGVVSSLAGASDVPVIGRFALVSPRDRHAIIFGADTLDDPGVQDPLHIRWADRENIANWTPGTTTTAGSLTIGSGTGICSVAQTRQEILIWTDVDMHSMQYIGGVLIFGITQIARGTSIIGRNAATVYLGVAYWMGKSGFYSYDGQVDELPSTVEDYVLGDLNLGQSEKVMAGVNSDESEIIWFYPSASSSEVDRYVVYNIRDQLWYIGTMDRTAWIDSIIGHYPFAASADGFVYTHEFGNLDGSTTPESQIIAHVESGPVELGEGYSYMFVERLIPDVTFRGSTVPAPSVTMTLTAFDNPGLASTDSDNAAVPRSATAPVEQFTDNLWLRIRGRSLVYRVEDTVDATNADTGWRLGASRLSVRPDGRK